MDSEAARIRDLVIEAGVLVEWMETGRGDLEIVGAALLYLRDELCGLTEHTDDADACAAGCDMVRMIDQMLVAPPAIPRATRAA